jgi:hypothetical protein
MPAATLSPEDLAQRARFVFRGAVQKLGAATMPEVPVNDRTAVVRVEEVRQAPPELARRVGQEVTVQLAPGGQQIKEGDELVFYTNRWLSGNSIAVRSLGERPVPTARGRVARGAQAAEALPVTDAVLAQKVQDFKSRIESADVVVTGTVSNVRLPEPPAPSRTRSRSAAAVLPVATPPRSEHDPQWREAVVQVEAVHKGESPAQQVVVRFPSSMDVMWYKAPKFEPGQHGVFVLHEKSAALPETAARTRSLASASQASSAYTALHPADFQPLDKPASRSLLERSLPSIIEPEPPDEPAPPRPTRGASSHKSSTVRRAAALSRSRVR